MSHEHLLATIAELFCTESGDRNPREKQKMEPVINIHGQEDPASSCDLKSKEPSRRLVTSTSRLCTLAMLRFIKVRDQQDESENSIPFVKNIRPTAERLVDATWTWDLSTHGVGYTRRARPGTD
jgi:hypothetical protein